VTVLFTLIGGAAERVPRNTQKQRVIYNNSVAGGLQVKGLELT
jgi:hypothetical protein